jgi:diguanylate cyclase (GGDEF)-like protein/PAS domain S-box-containing protein
MKASTKNIHLPQQAGRPTGVEQACHDLYWENEQLLNAQRIACVGSWEMRTDNGEIAFSPQALEIIGESLGKPCLDNLLALISENDRLQLLEAYSNALDSTAIIEIEHTLNTRDGKRRLLRQRMQRAPQDADGNLRLAGTIQDVTHYKATSQALRDSEKKFRLLMAHAPHGIALLDGEGCFIEVNTALCEVLGYSPEELHGCNFRSFTHPDDLPAGEWHLAEARSSDRVHLRYEKRYLRKNGSTIWVEVSLSAQHDDNGKLALLVAHIQDLTARKAEEAEIRRQVYTDSLTGLPNRRMFMDRLEFTWNQAQRHDRSFAIIYLDLDDFKPINDQLGHAAGDALLIEVSRRLLDCTRTSDTVARIGGDEFVVLLAEVKERSAPGRIAEKILRRLSEPMDANGHRLAVRASLGVVSHATDRFGSPIAMLHAADSAMYSAKRTGGGRYQHSHHASICHAPA